MVLAKALNLQFKISSLKILEEMFSDTFSRVPS